MLPKLAVLAYEQKLNFVLLGQQLKPAQFDVWAEALAGARCRVVGDAGGANSGKDEMGAGDGCR